MSSPVIAAVAVSVVFLIPACVEAQSLPSVPQPPAAATPSDPLALDNVTPPATTDIGSNLDQPIAKIAGTAHGCAVLDKDFPGLRTHPMYGFFKNMSLHQIAAMSKGKITTDMLTQAQTDLSGPSSAAVPDSVTPIAVSAR